MVSERIILPKTETETERPGEGITVKKKGGGGSGERGKGIKAANVQERQCGERQREIDDKPLTSFMN